MSLLCAPLLAQTVFKALSSAASTAPAAAKYADPLGRDNPRGTLTGFIDAAQRGDNERAAEYLQLPRQETEIDTTRVVDDLKALLNNAYVGRLGAVTDNPEAALRSAAGSPTRSASASSPSTARNCRC